MKRATRIAAKAAAAAAKAAAAAAAVTNLVHGAATKQKAAIEVQNMQRLSLRRNLKASRKQQLLLRARRTSLT